MARRVAAALSAHCAERALPPRHWSGGVAERGPHGRHALVTPGMRFWDATGIYVRAVAFGAGVVLVMQPFIGQYNIPSGSMESTLDIGDVIVVSRMWLHGGHVDRGDIIVFHDPDNWLEGRSKSPYLVKRVIGVAGDRVSGDGMGGLWLNGTRLDEPYVKDGGSGMIRFDVTVRDGYVWVMGDNRDNSADSRRHMDDSNGGQVPVSDIVGIADLRYWPLDRVGLLGSAEGIIDGQLADADGK